jgi:hypothetical protein
MCFAGPAFSACAIAWTLSPHPLLHELELQGDSWHPNKPLEDSNKGPAEQDGHNKSALEANSSLLYSTNLIIMLGMMQVTKRIPFDDPNVLNLVRGVYLASNLIIVAIYLYVQSQINKKKDLTTLKYVEPAPVGSSEEGKLVTTTIQAYDSAQLKTAFRGQLMGVGMMAFMHLYLRYTNPLVIQSIIPLKGAFESNLVKIHVFGQPASGELKRPFKTGGGFMSAMQGGAAQSDKKAVEAAERAGRGGAKEE